MWHRPENFFSFAETESPAARLFEGLEYVWEALDLLEPFIKKIMAANVAELRRGGDLLLAPWAIHENRAYENVRYQLSDPAKGRLEVFHEGRRLEGAALVMAGAVLTSDDIEIGAGALVESGALIKGPTIIGPRSEVRQGAYVRGAVMSCPGSIIGHVTETKNTLLLDGAKAGHFAYLGDSLLGHGVNLGAGTKLANLKMTNNPCRFMVDGRSLTVARRKFGAIIGDLTELGCNSVTNPGVLLGRNCRVRPNASVAGGFYPEDSFLGRDRARSAAGNGSEQH